MTAFVIQKALGVVEGRLLWLVPFLLSVPFAYVPKVLPGDTQPWVAIGALCAFVWLAGKVVPRRRTLWVLALCVLCAAAMLLRTGLTLLSLRFMFSLTVFFLLWTVIPALRSETLLQLVRATIIVWFAVGLYQVLAMRFNWPVVIPGRFVAGRSGVPSLAPEPSMFGGIAVLLGLYIASEQETFKNSVFKALTAFSIVLSGSLVGVVALVFLLVSESWRGRVTYIVAATALTLFMNVAGVSGMGDRLASIALSHSSEGEVSSPEPTPAPLGEHWDGFEVLAWLQNKAVNVARKANNLIVAIIKSDTSTNLRVGHVVYTCFYNLPSSLSFASGLEFQKQYNSFARGGSVFVETGSDFILPAVGDLIFNSGVFGLSLACYIVWSASRSVESLWKRSTKALTVAFFLLSPFSIANVFLMLYVLKRDVR